MSMRQRVAGACALGALSLLYACDDGLFAPRTPAGHVANVSVAMDLTGGSASAFDKVDALHVLLTTDVVVFDLAPVAAQVGPRFDAARAASGFTFLDTTVAFQPTGDVTRVKLPVELSAAVDTVNLYVDFLSAGNVVFLGSAQQAVLKAGENTPVTLVLSPRPAGVIAATVPTLTAIGDTAYGRAAVLFATGDTIRGAKPRWNSLNPLIVATPGDSLLVAVAEGQTQVVATYFSVYGSWSQTMTVSVNATVASVSVSPVNPAVLLATGYQQFSAVARDRRGHVLTRTIQWSSSNPQVATVDSKGTATLVSVGTTYIAAAAGTVRDSTLLTVQGVAPPTAPTNLTATGASSQQVNLSFNDNSTDETEFRIESCEGSNCSNFTQSHTLSGETSYTGRTTTFDVPVTGTQTYRVRACNAGGCSAYSNTAVGSPLAAETTVPAAPTNLTATLNSSNHAVLSWSHPGTNVVGFSIERSTGLSGANFVEIAAFYGTMIQGFTDNTTVSYTYYQYRVRAWNAAGYSAYSNTASLITY